MKAKIFMLCACWLYRSWSVGPVGLCVCPRHVCVDIACNWARNIMMGIGTSSGIMGGHWGMCWGVGSWGGVKGWTASCINYTGKKPAGAHKNDHLWWQSLKARQWTAEWKDQQDYFELNNSEPIPRLFFKYQTFYYWCQYLAFATKSFDSNTDTFSPFFLILCTREHNLMGRSLCSTKTRSS